MNTQSKTRSKPALSCKWAALVLSRHESSSEQVSESETGINHWQGPEALLRVPRVLWWLSRIHSRKDIEI